MTTTPTKVIVAGRCSVCQKEPGTSFCTGCGTYFCTRDFKEHRKSLFTDMDDVISSRNDLQERITKTIQQDDSEIPLLEQIDQWQSMMLEKVNVLAEHTRQQVSQLLHSRRIRLTNDFKRFSQDLVHLKQTENFVEHDITRMKYIIHQFNHELKQLNKPFTIELHTEHSDRIVWSQLLYVEDKSTYAGIQQREQQVKDEEALAALFPRGQPREVYSLACCDLEFDC